MTDALPAGVQYRDFGDGPVLATQGPPVYGEPTDNGWRAWDIHRSKVGTILDRGIDTGLSAEDTVLYLGAAAGTTVSHIADFAGPTYAIDFAARPVRSLLDAATQRRNLFPLLKDARNPHTYAHVVEADIDTIIQDVATRGQATVAIRNKQFLASDGHLVLAVKARSETVTESPESVFDSVLTQLREEYTIETTTTLDPIHTDHLAIVARPKDP